MEHNRILGVGKEATPEEIQLAFHELAFQFHPDYNDAFDLEQFQRIREARDALLEKAKNRTPTRVLDTEKIAELHEAALAAAPDATAKVTVLTPSHDPDQLSQEQLEHVQSLDEAVRKHTRMPNIVLWYVIREPEDVRRHHKKIDINNKRIQGKC